MAKDITLEELFSYLDSYIQAYKEEYNVFTNSPPRGGGYPDLDISPYLNASDIHCYVTNDGIVIADYSYEPDYQWEIAGGPALVVDYPETRCPEEITDILRDNNLLGKNIGLYRIVGKVEEGIPKDLWNGELGKPTKIFCKSHKGISYTIKSYDYDLRSLVQRLTYGAFCYVLDIKLDDSSADFWLPHIIRDLGFLPADRSNKRFFHYLEIHPHREINAWDERNIKVRVNTDVRRDFGASITENDQGGSLSFGKTQNWPEHYYDRISSAYEAVESFKKLLRDDPNANENTFHKFLRENSIILDLYGSAINKPKLYYPEDDSPLGKEYVEPDFIIKYPGNQYKLVELEKPSKKLATKKGQPRSEFTQASFQIAEWKTYLKKHYDLVKRRFPNISINHTSMLVISRSSKNSIGEDRDIISYKELIKEQFSIDEILTYDDLIERAEKALIQLSSLNS